MMKPGKVVLSIPDTVTAGDEARLFCRVRKLSGEDVRIVRRDGLIEVEVKQPCVMAVQGG